MGKGEGGSVEGGKKESNEGIGWCVADVRRERKSGGRDEWHDGTVDARARVAVFRCGAPPCRSGTHPFTEVGLAACSPASLLRMCGAPRFIRAVEGAGRSASDHSSAAGRASRIRCNISHQLLKITTSPSLCVKYPVSPAVEIFRMTDSSDSSAPKGLPRPGMPRSIALAIDPARSWACLSCE